jgi:hypothetical protein
MRMLWWLSLCCCHQLRYALATALQQVRSSTAESAAVCYAKNMSSRHSPSSKPHWTGLGDSMPPDWDTSRWLYHNNTAGSQAQMAPHQYN